MKRFRMAGRSFKILVLAAIASGALIVGVTSSFGATGSTPYRAVATESPDPVDSSQVATCPANQQGVRNPCIFSRFAERLTDAADLTGDGIRDVFGSSWVQDLPASQVGGVLDNNAGRIALINGATQQVVYKVTPEPQENGNFGFYISVPGDVGPNRDGKEDLFSGASGYDVGTGPGGTGCTFPTTPEPNQCNENQGRGYVLSGPTGTLISALNNFNPQPDGGFSSRVGAAGDVGSQGGGPKDGVSDILAAAPSNDIPAGCGINPATGQTWPAAQFPANCRRNEGEVFVVDGRTFGLIRTLNIPAADQKGPTCGSPAPAQGVPPTTPACGSLGGGPQVIGDLNRDGTHDHLVPATNYAANPTLHGRIYIFSGATGTVLARIDQPQPDTSASFGLQDLDRFAPGDLNADGYPELYGTGFQQDGPGNQAGAGRAWVFDGKRTLETGTGQLLYDLVDPFLGPSRAFGWADSRTDYNKDGRTDLYISNLQSQNISTSVYDGTNGLLLKNLILPQSDQQAPQPGNNGSSLGWSSRAMGDLNRDCEPDYVAAAPYQDVGLAQDQGKVFFFLSAGPSTCPRVAPRPPTYPPPTPPRPPAESSAFPGCPAATANVVRGTAAANTITGTARADRIFAGAGNDRVSALAGNDCVDLGSGTDNGQGGAGRDLMRGGIGGDRISGSSGNDNLNGQSGSDNINGGSGNDSLNGSSGSDRISGGSGTDRISSGSGADRISARDRRRDRISCGGGRDRVTADRSDRVSRNCERVRRR